MRGKCIIITGYCATGKSTFSTRLGSEIGIPCFNKDTMKETLADGIGNEHIAVLGRLSDTTFDIMLHIAQKIMLSWGAFIMEANFKPREIVRIAPLLERHGYDCLTYLFTGDHHTIYNRYIERDTQRHWAHTRGAVEEERFIQGQLPLGEVRIGNMIYVDTSDFGAVDYKSLVDTAKRFFDTTLVI